MAPATHRWGPEFASRSFNVGFVVDETESGYVFLGVSPVLPFHRFHSAISPHSSYSFRFSLFHFFRPCDDASGVVGRHPRYSQTFNKGASSHLTPRPDPASGQVGFFFFILYIMQWRMVGS